MCYKLLWPLSGGLVMLEPRTIIAEFEGAWTLILPW